LDPLIPSQSRGSLVTPPNRLQTMTFLTKLDRTEDCKTYVDFVGLVEGRLKVLVTIWSQSAASKIE